MKFRSKVDCWIAALVLVAPVLGLVAVVTARQWQVAVVAVAVLLSIGAIVWPCDYTLDREGLLVRSGVIKWRVPYASIDRVYPTRNPLSSPAWSLDRIAIVYGRRRVMVSPEGKGDFLSMLASSSGLRQRGQELVR